MKHRYVGIIVLCSILTGYLLLTLSLYATTLDEVQLDRSFNVALLMPSAEISDCDRFYSSLKELQWLSSSDVGNFVYPAYASNAGIACLVCGDGPQANSIRYCLQNKMYSRITEKLEAQLGGVYESNDLKYENVEVPLSTSLVYNDHVHCYQEAGCKMGPAHRFFWYFVTHIDSVFFTGRTFATLFLQYCINVFGACNGGYNLFNSFE